MALDKCGLGEGDALSRKRRRFQRSQNAQVCGLKTHGKRRRTPVCSSWPEERHDPLTKLRVFRDMKKGKGAARERRSTISSLEEEVQEDDDERMELSDIEWYTRRAVDNEWDNDDLDMSEVELGVMTSPRQTTPETDYFKPITSFAEVNNVPTCLYRPLGDIIEEVYLHLGLDTADKRGIKLLHDVLGERRTRTGKEIGAVGVFPTRPLPAKDWAALTMARKIIRRDRLAKCAIYRFTFAYSKDEVPARFLRWQTWNHPTLADIKNGLRLKLDEHLAAQDPERSTAPSSPAIIEDELDEEVDDILSELDVADVISEGAESNEEADEEEGEDSEVEEEDVESDDEVVDEEDFINAQVEPSPPTTPHVDREAAEEDQALFEALGLVTPRRHIAPLPRAAILSRLPRALNDSPPGYTERSYRDRSPTPPPPFNAQTDNLVIIAPSFAPAAVVPAILPRLLPPFAMPTSPSRLATHSPVTPTAPASRRVNRVTSGEIIMPGGYARPGPRPVTSTSRHHQSTNSTNSFDLALDMEEAETELELAELGDLDPEAQPETGGLLGLVRSWWAR